MHTGSYKPCLSTSTPVQMFAAHASFCSVCMSTFNYSQSSEQQPLRAGEKYLFLTHTTLILADTGRGKQWFPDNQAHLVFIPSVSKENKHSKWKAKLAFHFSQDHCRKILLYLLWSLKTRDFNGSIENVLFFFFKRQNQKIVDNTGQVLLLVKKCFFSNF